MGEPAAVLRAAGGSEARVERAKRALEPLPQPRATAEREQEPIEPLVLELGPLQAALLDDRLPELEGLGISCENFGGRSFLVRAIPALGPGHEDLREALPDLFDELVEEDEGWRERLMVGLSCRAALRKGRPLDPEERRDLLRQLARTATPMTCPHGAPIVLRLDQALLSRQFRW